MYEIKRYIRHDHEDAAPSFEFLYSTSSGSSNRKVAEGFARVEAREGSCLFAVGRKFDGFASVVFVDGEFVVCYEHDLIRLNTWRNIDELNEGLRS